MRAMKDGKLARIEELTRVGSDVQDTLITILSEKTLPIPELDREDVYKRQTQDCLSCRIPCCSRFLESRVPLHGAVRQVNRVR